MSLNIRYKTDLSGFRKSIRILRKGLIDELRSGLKLAGDQVSINIRGRFSGSYPSLTSEKPKLILEHIRAGEPVWDGNNIFIGIGNIAELDKATEVMAKSTGKVYHLWRLLELGYGMKGGFRNDLYDIYPIYPTSSQGQSYYREYGGTRRKGVHVSNPERRVKPALVFYAGGRLVFAAHVKHPGAAGRHFFMTISRDWYSEDVETIKALVWKAINPLLDRVSYKGKNARA